MPCWTGQGMPGETSHGGGRGMSVALSYSSGESATPLLGDTIGGNFDATVRAFGDREALVDRTPADGTARRWTYAELAADVDALALGLLEMGIVTGDRVGIWAPNCAEWTLTQYATAKIGAILVNINPAYRTRELEFVLNQSGSTLLVAAERLKTSDYAAMIAEVRPHCPELDAVVLLGSPEWHALLERGRQADRGVLDAIELDTDDPINIQYTSGTTGFPKGATLSHHNILNIAFFVGELCNYTEADRICIPVPFYHCFGMVMGNLSATSHGACMVIPAPAFDPAATLQAVQAERCTSLYGVPTMFIAELSVPDFADYDLSSLRTGIMAGSPCPVEVMKQEIEEFLYTHPDILDAQVIGVPDAKYGEELMVWVRLRAGAPALTAEALRAFCAGQLAHYKIPRYVHIVEEFPMTVTGKVRKVEMRERSVEILGLDAT